MTSPIVSIGYRQPSDFCSQVKTFCITLLAGKQSAEAAVADEKAADQSTPDTGLRVEKIEVIKAKPIRLLPGNRISANDAARVLGRRPKTLKQWRWRRTGPAWVKVHGRIQYDYDSVLTHR
jgi:hypothetical protein